MIGSDEFLCILSEALYDDWWGREFEVFRREAEASGV